MKMKKRAAFDVRIFLLTSLIVMGVMSSFFFASRDMAINYASISDAQTDDSFLDTYDQLDTIHAEAEDIETSLSKTGTGSESSSTQFYGGALSSLKITLSSLSMYETMFSQITSYLPIPPMWKEIAITAVIIALATTILFMIFQSTGK